MTYKTLLFMTALMLTGCTNSESPDSPKNYDAASPQSQTTALPNTAAFAAEFETSPSQYKHMLNCFGQSGHHATRRAFTCPIGNTEEEVIRLGTHSTYGSHLDFRSASYLPMPAPAWVCASNGFVQLQNEYTPEELTLLQTATEDTNYQSIFAQKHASYYLAAKFKQASGAPARETYWQLLQASAEADNCKAPLRYELYAREAIHVMKMALETPDKTEQDYWVWQIALPNFYRRLGDYSAATAWLDDNEQHIPSKEAFDPAYYALAKQVLRKAIDRQDTETVAIHKRYLEDRETANED